jgi:hypothetical protein
MRNAARTDANQADIVKALKDAGINVEYIKLPVDLMVWVPRRDRMELMEVKMPDGRLTKDQVEFIARWPGPVHVVHNIQEALEAVVGKEAMS